MTNEEVARKPDADCARSDPPRDLHVDDRERDRDAEASIEHLVEHTVLWIVVVLAVASKAALDEDRRPHRGRDVFAIRAQTLRAFGESIERAEIALHVDRGVFLLRDQ